MSVALWNMAAMTNYLYLWPANNLRSARKVMPSKGELMMDKFGGNPGQYSRLYLAMTIDL